MIREIKKIYSVSELNRSIRTLLENRFSFISVSGEVSNLRKPFSGHLYFTLKDDRGQIKAVLFKMQNRYLVRQPEDGQKVICRGQISVYEPRGDYQLIVEQVDFHGAGELQAAFERLKEKLSAEGLFDQERKKPIAKMPDHVTLITSPKGAAVHDFLQVAKRRFPQAKLAIYPVVVQGEHAVGEIIAGLEMVNRYMDTDVIVICRGGGSIEDLQPFNNELLARAIAASKVPVVSAVGHEIDFTIADFVSDLRAPTPSVAAELILPDGKVLKKQLETIKLRLARCMNHKLDGYVDRIELNKQKIGDLSNLFTNLFIRVDQQSVQLCRGMEQMLSRNEQKKTSLHFRLERQNPDIKLQLASNHVAELHNRLAMAMRQRLNNCTSEFKQQKTKLETVSPLATLARGYAIIRKKSGEVVTDSNQVQDQETIEALLYRGKIEAVVKKRENRVR
jgi:exodeoxyribonuclease VII large subunit